MTLVRPRLTDYHGIALTQGELDFAIPFLNEDIPLYVDPFLLWRSPSQQDQALHTALTNSFNYLNWLIHKGRQADAERHLITASECDEVGLGVSARRRGARISGSIAQDILSLFKQIPQYDRFGFTHFEEIQLYVDGISKDRISDLACSFLKSFLIDYTIDQCEKLGIPMTSVRVASLYDYRHHRFDADVALTLPAHPERGLPILFVPKRWLRYVPWISFDDYFAAYCPKDDVVNRQGGAERVHVLTYNRQNYDAVTGYVQAKEKTAADCRNDPLFSQIPILSARRKFQEIKSLPTGTTNNADKHHENAVAELLASLLYPHLDFADTQSRTDGGTLIRDLVFYNNRSTDFLEEILSDYGSRQLVMELKNVHTVEREHINQLNRYLSNEFG